MDYFTMLNFKREPFSNSPEPDFFYQSPQHMECLQKLELSVRLRRGLNTVIGDVGAGKTTICRQIIRRFAGDTNVETFLMLDPGFDSPIEFLRAVLETLGIPEGAPDLPEWRLKEKIKNHLFDRGVGAGKTLVLIIDEGQKIADFSLEILREFLNYETNDHKLLQIVIFAQKEFAPILEAHPGFADRINFSYELPPMTFSDTRAMVRFRLDTARGETAGRKVRFTFPALWAVYRATGGYPRKIVGLCHRVVLALIIRERLKAGYALVRSCARGGEPPRRAWRMALAGIIGGIAITLIGPDFGDHLFVARAPEEPAAVVAPQPVAEVSIPLRVPPQRLSAAEAAPPESEQCPASLGWLVVRKGETICKVIRGVYGIDCIDSRVALIHQANPHVHDPDRIEPGAMLKLPAVPADGIPAADGGCWVALARSDNLEDAYALYRGYREQGLSAQVCSHWNGRDGLRFELILKGRFDGEGAARKAIGALPTSLSSGARIITEWDRDTVFFSAIPADSET